MNPGSQTRGRLAEILLVEDSPADVRLVRARFLIA
jgi:hypothetical protein